MWSNYEKKKYIHHKPNFFGANFGALLTLRRDVELEARTVPNLGRSSRRDLQ